MADPSEYGRQVRKKTQEKTHLGAVKKQKTLAAISPVQRKITTRRTSSLMQMAISDTNPTLLNE